MSDARLIAANCCNPTHGRSSILKGLSLTLKAEAPTNYDRKRRGLVIKSTLRVRFITSYIRSEALAFSGIFTGVTVLLPDLSWLGHLLRICMLDNNIAKTSIRSYKSCLRKPKKYHQNYSNICILFSTSLHV